RGALRSRGRCGRASPRSGRRGPRSRRRSTTTDTLTVGTATGTRTGTGFLIGDRARVTRASLASSIGMPRTLFVSLLLTAACTSPVPFDKCESTNHIPETLTATVAYYRDVAPIIEARCVRCHQQGNIGPFPLTTYQEVFAQRTAIKAAVLTRHMPPWL